ncbi:MAG: galactokinase [Eubacterium sp.]|nr:galactokinase [Eubacterium sp.]
MKTADLIRHIEDGKLSDKLIRIYIDDSKIKYQTERYIAAVKKYTELFSNSKDYDDDVCIISAPGRTEVCGNHTDHQRGEVLTASINDDAIAIVGSSNSVNIMSEGYPMISFSIDDISKKDNEEGTTVALIKGVLAGCRDKGFSIGGFNAYITSDVLGGSGLSSSAAFETVIGNVISNLYNDGKIDAVTIARIGQYAENHYFGKPCGLMDQMACSVGGLCHIDFASPEEPIIESIDVSLDEYGYSLCITDTKGSHADLTPDYAAVPAEMKSIASYFGKNVLKELNENDVLENINSLREKYGDRAVLRAFHFYEENIRVKTAAEALKNHDFNSFLDNISKSGNSSYKYLQNVFTTHDITHQNVSIALCISEMVLGDKGGVARVHGGGFAGTIQAFVKNEFVSKYKDSMDSVFGEGACAVLKIRNYGGIRVI